MKKSKDSKNLSSNLEISEVKTIQNIRRCQNIEDYEKTQKHIEYLEYKNATYFQTMTSILEENQKLRKELASQKKHIENKDKIITEIENLTKDHNPFDDLDLFKKDIKDIIDTHKINDQNANINYSLPYCKPANSCEKDIKNQDIKNDTVLSGIDLTIKNLFEGSFTDKSLEGSFTDKSLEQNNLGQDILNILEFLDKIESL